MSSLENNHKDKQDKHDEKHDSKINHADKDKSDDNFTSFKNEALWILITFVISLIVLKIIYFRESFIVVIKLVASWFWLYLLPGYSALYYWKKQIPFLERMIFGFIIGAGLVGSISFFLGVIGFNLIFQTIAIPATIILLGFVFEKLLNKKA